MRLPYATPEHVDSTMNDCANNHYRTTRSVIIPQDLETDIRNDYLICSECYARSELPKSWMVRFSIDLKLWRVI